MRESGRYEGGPGGDVETVVVRGLRKVRGGTVWWW